MKDILKIEVSFPLGVEITSEQQQELTKVISSICDSYNKQNPTRVMWPFGQGYKLLSNLFMLDDGEPMEFDLNCYHIEVSEREAYEGENKNAKRN